MKRPVNLKYSFSLFLPLCMQACACAHVCVCVLACVYLYTGMYVKTVDVKEGHKFEKECGKIHRGVWREEREGYTFVDCFAW